VDGEVAIFVFLLIWLDPAVGMVVFGAIKFPNASRETNGGLESTGKGKGDCRAWARTRRPGRCALRQAFHICFYACDKSRNGSSLPRSNNNNHGLEPQMFWSFCIGAETVGMPTGAMRGIADGGIDGNGFGNFGEQVSRMGICGPTCPSRRTLPFAWNGSSRHVAEQSGEAADQDGLSPNHKIRAAERVCGVKASEMEQIAAVVNLRRLAPVKMSN
jgi:hypothetical protein